MKQTTIKKFIQSTMDLLAKSSFLTLLFVVAGGDGDDFIQLTLINWNFLSSSERCCAWSWTYFDVLTVKKAEL